MVIVLLGPAGSGKDTQANLLAEVLKIPSISTGQLCRDEIQRGQTLGKFIDLYISKGKLIPTELLYVLLVERLSKPDCKDGFIMNGAPRTFEQVALVDNAARHINKKISHVISLEVPILETLVRLQKRAGIEKRSDDKDLKFILERLHSHYLDSDDIKNEYKDRNILHEVDGIGSIEDIHKKVLEIVQPK